MRAECWQKAVKESTQHIIDRITKYGQENISFSTQTLKLHPFIYQPSTKDVAQFLSYLVSWNGLNTKLIHITKQPKTYKDYQMKAKNWSNGCRAREYAKNLYPNMINKAKEYAILISNKLFQNDPQCQTIFADILIYSYLIKLCQAKVRILNNKRRVCLLCDKSIKINKSSETCKIFQSYAVNHNYPKTFPSHRKEAIDVYTMEMENNFKRMFLF